MVKLLKDEVNDDLKARDDCNVQLNDNAAALKEVSHAIKGLNAKIEDATATIATQVTGIEKNTGEIAAAEKAMTEATEQRKTENSEFVETVALNKDAVELILKAKDKLNAYYNPDMVRKEEVYQNPVTGEITPKAFLQEEPDTWDAGERKNKGQSGNSALALLDQIVNDLNNDTKDREHAETTAQRDYEKLSSDLKQQVIDCNKALAQAQQIKAETESSKITRESSLSSKTDEDQELKKSESD